MGTFSLFSWSSGGASQLPPKPLDLERDSAGNWFYTMFSSSNRRRIELTEQEKLDIVLRNPAVLKVFALNCDLFSLGKANKYKDGKIEVEDFLYSVTRQPNFKQSWTQFMWDYMFWVQTGTAYLYNPLNAKVLKETNPIQWLNPCKINWDATATQKLKAFIFNGATLKEVMQSNVSYSLGNGQVQLMKLNEIVPFFDLSNGLDDNFYRGASRIDALYKVVLNSEMALDAKYINLEMAQKFFVSGQQDPENTSQLPMADEEKRSIEEVVRSLKKVHAVKSKITIERFVDNLANLKLDDSFNDDMQKIASIMNVPSEVLDINTKDSTFENQEKATARQVEYSLKPKGKPLTDWFELQYNFQDIRIGWEGLSFNQVFEKVKAEKDKVVSETLLNLMKAGVEIATINQILGTNFNKLEYENAKNHNNNQGIAGQGN